MPAPTIKTSQCRIFSIGRPAVSVALPTWAPGDLGVILLNGDLANVSWVPAQGWSLQSEDSNANIPSAGVFTRVLESGDSSPIFSTGGTGSPETTALVAIINAGTFNDDDPINAVTSTNGWAEGNSTAPQADGITTSKGETLALAMASINADGPGNNKPYAVVTSGWNETLAADCGGGFRNETGGIIADKVIESKGATGDVLFSITGANLWSAAIMAINPKPLDDTDPPIGGGGRVMVRGEMPKWWKEWEEPQPNIDPPEPERGIAELIAEAAADLGAMPRTERRAERSVPARPIRLVKVKSQERPRQPVEIEFIAEPDRMVIADGAASFEHKALTERQLIQSEARRRRRQTAALLLFMRLLN